MSGLFVMSGMPHLPLSRPVLAAALAVLLAAPRPAAAAPAEAIDFSTAGYGGGGVPLPAVPARLTVAPTGGDDTRLIQAALDAVGRLRWGRTDSRGGGAAARHLPDRRPAALGASGVVLRGHGTTLVATGLPADADRGPGRRRPGPSAAVTGAATPAGSRVLPLASVDGFSAGQRVLVRRPSTKAWIAALGMGSFAGNYAELRLDWIPGSRGPRLGADDPRRRRRGQVRHAGRADHHGPRGEVRRRHGLPLAWPGRISRVGVEGLACVSEFDAARPLDEEHAWIAVAVDRAENAWVRAVTARQFVSACVWATARAVTIEDCASLQPVAESGSWRRLGLRGRPAGAGSCATGDGRHDFAAGLCAAGSACPSARRPARRWTAGRSRAGRAGCSTTG